MVLRTFTARRNTCVSVHVWPWVLQEWRPFSARRNTKSVSNNKCNTLASPQRPDGFCGPPSFLFTGYKDHFPGVNQVGYEVDHPNHLAPRLRMSGAVLLLPLYAFMAWTATSLLFNPLNAELNPIRHLLALVGARHIVHVSRLNPLPFSLLLRRMHKLKAWCQDEYLYLLACRSAHSTLPPPRPQWGGGLNSIYWQGWRVTWVFRRDVGGAFKF